MRDGEDHGMAEAVWPFLVDDFGPLVVSIDASGNSKYDKIAEEAKRKGDSLSQLAIAK